MQISLREIDPDTVTSSAIATGPSVFGTGLAGPMDCEESVIPGGNTAPVAECQDLVLQVDASCTAAASADEIAGGSTDADGDALDFSADPEGPFGLGETAVTVTVSDGEDTATCDATITVVDTAAPVVSCNSDATITPPDAPISYTATASDDCEVTVEVIDNYCRTVNGSGREMSKMESCVVSFEGDTVTIEDSGGVGDNIEWTVLATDSSDNRTEATCSLTVENPGKGKKGPEFGEETDSASVGCSSTGALMRFAGLLVLAGLALLGRRRD